MIKRQSVAGIGVSAALLIAVLQFEGYTDKAVIPVPGDVPTIGAGRTEGVKLGDKTEPVREMVFLLNNLENKYARKIRECIHVPLHVYEFDAYVSLSYNIGTSAFCKSTLVKKLNAGDYAGACQQILVWDKFKGKPLRGLTVRRQEEYAKCLNSAD
ncbi:COG3772 Phage-related lysozyme (muraminidase) [uncultured Caudovirales phage]|uniref:Endolysin n=1 Tax=uncultured Caudovirales phage TaxID=2100421 RepID=A0A6J5PTM4_9CAUD|nr:COG3772 Phage-related lysozyme (muraminidase) [uncultured Caudovirales phage]CAB4178573.1 COG3772 Phage-related lysozyme (muraminidase) [uncultured Caudovirales phage]CAB4184092.1 COG3772 Phage-related lysozyme (muraminidase) [uncultured Caudovirales phage]CAB4202540.1 COG3772 Phage-related lysozyme (muraminidase) [uncultured Caudovirales phage]CAB4215027.1 COG3772 Phage-related lysozyme (muraminidase) [uncultured Caudovirales phage]